MAVAGPSACSALSHRGVLLPAGSHCERRARRVRRLPLIGQPGAVVRLGAAGRGEGRPLPAPYADWAPRRHDAFQRRRFFLLSGMRVILTGVTGMVGEGVLLECALRIQQSTGAERVAQSDSAQPPQAGTVARPGFSQPGSGRGQAHRVRRLLYCAGVSLAGMSEADYTVITYDTRSPSRRHWRA